MNYKVQKITDLRSYNTFFHFRRDDSNKKHSCDIVAVKAYYGPIGANIFYTSMVVSGAIIQQGCVGVNSFLAEELGLKENEIVFVEFLFDCPSIRTVKIRPDDYDDETILTTLRIYAENTILHQVRVVAANQKLPIKIGNLPIRLIIDSIEPNGNFGKLEQLTKVEVLDVANDNSNNNNIIAAMAKRSGSMLWWFVAYMVGLLNDRLKFRRPISRPDPKPREECRVSRDPHSDHDLVIVSDFLKKGFRYKVIPIIEKCEEKASKSNTNAKGVILSCKQSGCVNIPQYCLELDIGSRVDVIEANPTDALSILILNSSLNKSNFKLWLSLENICNDIETSTKCAINLDCNSNSLIIGPTGSGKSNLIKTLSEKFRSNNWYTEIVKCKSLKGKSCENLKKRLLKVWCTCAYREPSVLLVDDIDCLFFPLADEDPEKLFTQAYNNNISDLFTELAEDFSKKNRICIVATVSSLDKLGPGFTGTRGPRLFNLVLHIPELKSEERKHVFELFGLNVSPDIVNKTHGYRIQDLCDVISRAKFEAITNDRPIPTDEDFLQIIDTTTPIALQGEKVKIDASYRWSDVGGMHDIKVVLDEIFRWPSKFPQIFNTCPLKLQTGALLYGPPGCGKTFLAGALATECGMNFKTVKGPELLGKFVGESEAAVRNLFEKARQASPCLLFFDELDSLAPRRGADSTGVTDRVVNQLLTELDGVEGNSGVWILAASSRPDLIDPALLRPGRIDRAIYCPLPNADERLEIFQVLGRGLKICDWSNAEMKEEFLSKTEEFSGADLQALLYNAQMDAIKSYTDDDNDEDIEITWKSIKEALSTTNSSLSGSEKAKYDKIYDRFKNPKASKDDPTEIIEQRTVQA